MTTEFRVEIATGGNPARALATAAIPYVGQGEAWYLGIAHDDECPCITRGGMHNCTCEIVELTGRRLLP